MSTSHEVGAVFKGKGGPPVFAGQGDLFVDQTTNRVYLHNGLRFFEITLPVFDVRMFGARGDGTGDDGPAINRAIAAAQATGNGTVMLGPGVFRVTTQIVVAGANEGVAIVGMPTPATQQQGSIPPPCAINWAGGASAVFAVTASFTSFHDFAIYNTGSGTVALSFAPNGHAEVVRVSFAGPNGSTAWSTAAIDSSAGLNYSSIRSCNFDVAPAIKMAGVHTTLEIANCVFDAIGASPAINAAGVAGDMVAIRNCTFNATAAVATFFDNSATSDFINNLIVECCEFDGSSVAVQSYIAKLKNVRNFVFAHNTVEAFSNGANAASLIQLTGVLRAEVRHNSVATTNPPLVDGDADSRVFVGPNRINQASAVRILDTSGATPGNLVAITPGTPVANKIRLHGEIVNPQAHAVFVATHSTNANFTVELPGPTDGTDPGYMEPGQVFTVLIRNASGGAMGTVTLDAGQFKTSGAFTSPANGKSRAITFYHNGTVAVELFRSAADVDN